VLGSCGAWPEPNRACSGFLLEHNGFRVVLDLGHGTLPRLLAHCPDGAAAVDAVVITHEHSDHCVDLNGLFRARYFVAAQAKLPKIPLYCTAGVLDRVGHLEPSGSLLETFDVREFPRHEQVGPFRLDSTPLPHFVPNFGVRLTAPGLTVAYTGDTGPDGALASLGEDADLYIVEASHAEPPAEPPAGQPADRPRSQLSAREAGEWARRAGARRLMLTHFWPGSDREASVAAAAERFDGEIIAAGEDLTVELA
jgi:ribonuclease BN (tRNA processing enzyme)